MKSLILYWSKYGATKACADKLEWYMKGKVEIVNINNANNISLKDYDIIIIASPLYIGKFNKKIKMFTSELQDVFFFGKPFKIQNPISGAIECCIDLSIVLL